MLPPETQKLITDFCAQIAADLTARLLEAAGKRVARRFEAPPRQTALSAALAEGLESAFERLPLTTDLRDHYFDLFQQFIKREAVVEELCAMIDPNPAAPLDIPRLRAEFVAAGFDPDHLPGINFATTLPAPSPAREIGRRPTGVLREGRRPEQLENFDELILTFVGAFYNAAAKQKELQVAIQIGLLRKLADDSGALRLLSERTANATERTASATETSADWLRLIHEAIQSPEPGKKLDTYQTVAAGLRRGGRSIILEQNGSIRIEEGTSPEAASHIDLTPVRELVEELRRKIIQPDAPPSPEEIAERRDRYCRLIISLYGQLRFQGLSTSVRPIDLPLEQVYVHLRAVAETPEAADEFSPEERRLLRLLEEKEGGRDEDLREAHLRLDALRRERWTRDRLERFPIAEALRDAERRGLVILGDPGSGKSTLLHFVALVFARGAEEAHKHLALNGPDADRLPIIAPLAAYDEMLNHDSELTIRDFLARYYDARQNLPGLGPAFEAALNAGRALVLLDGLDEVVEESRRKFVAERASAFIREALQNGNRALLTSRIYGYRAAPLSVSLPHVTVLDFRREEIELFARQWSRAMSAWDAGAAGSQLAAADELRAQNEERRLLEQIRSNPGVERLAVNPLLLTMLALLHRQVGMLPQRRIKLYDLYFDALIQNWEENRSRGARLDRPQRIDTLEAENILTPLALWLQGHRASGTATRPDLMTQVIRFYLRDEGLNPDAPDLPLPALRTAERRAEKFLDDMRQFSGLLVERGQNAFGFRHLTFQEYFAGRELARLDEDARWALLKPNLHANRWREPILLAAARLGVTLNRGDLATALVEQILDAGSEHEAILHRDLFLAADCAADDIGVELPLLRRIVEGLAPLAVSRIPSLAIGATRRLSKLAQLRAGDKPRLPEALDELIPSVEKATRETQAAILEAVYPVWLESDQLRKGIETLIIQSLRRSHAVETFTRFINTSSELRQVIAAKLDDPDEFERAPAITALAPLLPNHPHLLTAVAAKLNEGNHLGLGIVVCMAAIRALTPLLGKHTDLYSAIAAKLDDTDKYIRVTTIQALASLLPDYPDLLAAVAAKLDDAKSEVCSAAITALAPSFPESPDLHAAITEKLNDPRTEVCTAAIEALASLLPNYPDLRATVSTKLNDAKKGVCAAAIKALAPLLTDHHDLRAAVIIKLNDDASEVRRAAIEGLSKFVSRDAQITSKICNLLDHRDWATRHDTLNALAVNIRRKTLSTELIQPNLGNEGCLESRQAICPTIHLLTEFLREQTDLRAAVAAQLNNTDKYIRHAAIQTLASLLPDHPDLLTAVTTKLDDTEWYVRGAAIRALVPLISEHTNLHSAVVIQFEDIIRIRAASFLAVTTLSEQFDPDTNVYTSPYNIEWYMLRTTIEAQAALLTYHPDLHIVATSKLNDSDKYMRRAAIEALAPLLANYANLRAAVATKLDDANEYVRYATIKALAPLLPNYSDLRTAVAAKLNDSEWEVRRATIIALASLLTNYPNLRTAVAAKLNDLEWEVRHATMEVLSPLLLDHPDLCATIVRQLNDVKWYVRRDTIKALAPLLPNRPDLSSAVADQLNHPVSDVRDSAMTALTPLLPNSPDLRTAIAAQLNDSDNYVRNPAIYALAPLLPSHPNLHAVVASKLDDPMEDVRVAATYAMTLLLPTHPDLRARVVTKLDDPEWEVRCAAIIALTRLLPNDPDLRAKVVIKLDDLEWEVRRTAIIALASFAIEDLELRQRLSPALLIDDEEERSHCKFYYSPEKTKPRGAMVKSFGQLAARDPSTRAEMIKLLSSPDWRMRRSAAEVLAEAGKDCLLEALPQLLAALEDYRGTDSWPARIAAAELLLNDYRYSAEAIETILPALDYGTHPLVIVPNAAEIRKQAALALGKLKAEYRQPHVFDRLVRLLDEEKDPQVLDGAFNALLSLAAAPEEE